ncbi:hypothetical protein F5H01DRAFT_84956 [Linnemannia elongata]|nr:hypothetical protein F5H01DRAFT_84956 [Linnemannia elongata]
MVFNFARLIRPLGPADPEIDPAYLPDNITSYTEGPVTEPATNQSPEVQSDPPIRFQVLGIDAAAAQAEFDQDFTFIGEVLVADFIGEKAFDGLPCQCRITMPFLPAVCPPGSMLHCPIVSLFALYLPLLFCTLYFSFVCMYPTCIFILLHLHIITSLPTRNINLSLLGASEIK